MIVLIEFWAREGGGAHTFVDGSRQETVATRSWEQEFEHASKRCTLDPTLTYTATATQVDDNPNCVRVATIRPVSAPSFEVIL